MIGPGDPLTNRLHRVLMRYPPPPQDSSRINYDLIARLLHHLQSKPSDGAILVFLPGLTEIQCLYDDLMDSPYGFGNPTKYVIITLHSLLSPAEQCLVFRPPPRGCGPAWARAGQGEGDGRQASA